MKVAEHKLFPPLMSAKDDARVPIHIGGRRRPAPRSHRLTFALLGAFSGAVIACAVLGTPTLLPMLPRYECRVSTSQGPVEVRSASEAGARLAAARLASGPEAETMAARRRIADRRESWALTPEGPLPPLAPETESAALLRARAEVGITLAGEGAQLALPARPGVDTAALDRADRAVEHAALAADPNALRDALHAADAAEQQWLAHEGVARERMMRWQARERSRAERFILAAQVLEAQATPLQRDLVLLWLPEFALALEPSALATLESASRTSDHSEPRPFVLLWVSVLALSGLAGAGAGYALERASVRPRRAALDRPLAREGDLAFALATRLHVVGGESAGDLAAGVAQLAASFVARGERVLILDGGRDLKLHAAFGTQARWGLGECMVGESPLLGVVQRAIVNGLYLLPRGAQRAQLWPGATRVLDDALDHFARVILAVDVPGAVNCGDALRGRWIEGWWAGIGNRARRRAGALSARLGIAMHPFELELSFDRLHEELPGYIEALRAQLPEVATVEPAAAASSAPIATSFEVEREPLPAQVARIVETDVTTRERLRFLMWMRRVQAERRKREMPSVA